MCTATFLFPTYNSLIKKATSFYCGTYETALILPYKSGSKIIKIKNKENIIPGDLPKSVKCIPDHALTVACPDKAVVFQDTLQVLLGHLIMIQHFFHHFRTKPRLQIPTSNRGYNKR